MSHRLFPIRPAAFTPEFKNFLARGFFNLICPLAAYLLFSWARHMPEVLQGATYSTAGVLSLVSIYLWAGTLRNFFRFHQFLYRIFKDNPFHDETTTRMLAVGVNQENIYWNEESEFYNEKELYFRHWRTVGAIIKAVIFFIPRLVLWMIDKTKPPRTGSGSGTGSGTESDSGSASASSNETRTAAEKFFSQSKTHPDTGSGRLGGRNQQDAGSRNQETEEDDADKHTGTGIYSVAC